MKVKFNRVAGQGFFSDKDSSSVLYPSAYLKDIEGCGEKNYISVSHAIQINGRPACAAPQTMVSGSVSSLTRRNKNPLLPTQAASQFPDLVRFMWKDTDAKSTAPEITFGDPDSYFSTMAAGKDFEFRGNEWVADGSKEGKDTFRLSFPRAELVYDQCGAVVGRKIGATISWSAIDDETCKPYLLETVSANYYVSNSPDLDSLLNVSNPANMILDDLYQTVINNQTHTILTDVPNAFIDVFKAQSFLIGVERDYGY